MFFVISKILKVFLLPLTWIIGFLVLSYLIKNKRWKKRLFVTAIVVLVIFSDKPLLQWAQYMSTRSYAHQQLTKNYYRIAVIMGGFSNGMDTTSMQVSYLDDRGSRLWEAIKLYEAGKVEKIMITGDASINVNAAGSNTADAFKQYLRDFGIHDGNIILEQHARNTRENAIYSIAILDSLGYKPDQCLLITSATHLKRSLNSFEQEGWGVDCYATNIYPKPHPNFYSFIPQWKSLTDWHELLNEWFGIIVYKILGY